MHVKHKDDELKVKRLIETGFRSFYMIENDAFEENDVKTYHCLSCGKLTHDNEVLCIRCEKINSKNKG